MEKFQNKKNFKAVLKKILSHLRFSSGNNVINAINDLGEKLNHIGSYIKDVDEHLLGYMNYDITKKILHEQRFSNPKNLLKFGYKVFSQHDEDGIINEIFNRIGTTNKKFLEFGVGDGLENNSLYLLYRFSYLKCFLR